MSSPSFCLTTSSRRAVALLCSSGKASICSGDKFLGIARGQQTLISIAARSAPEVDKPWYHRGEEPLSGDCFIDGIHHLLACTLVKSLLDITCYVLSHIIQGPAILFGKDDVNIFSVNES